jgi:hypothetical protein
VGQVTIAEVLQWANLLIVPGLVYVVKLERRIMSLEFEIRALIIQTHHQGNTAS